MALNLDLDPGDILLVPPDSGAKITVADKSGRRTRVAVESAKPVKVLRARDARQSISNSIQRPTKPEPFAGPIKPKP